MKKLILLLILSINLFSCSKNTDCRLERLELIEYYDNLINRSSGNRDEQNRLISEREKKLAKLDC